MQPYLDSLRGWSIPFAASVLLSGALAGPAAAQTPCAPVFLSSRSADAFQRTVRVESGVAYVGDGVTLRIFDVSDPADPIELAGLSLAPNVDSLCVHDDLVFTAVGSYGLRIVDVSDPTSPQIIGSLPLGGFTVGVQVANDLAYLGNTDLGLVVVDVTDPTSPVYRGASLPFQVGNPKTVADNFVISGGLAYVAVTTKSPNPGDGLEGFNVFDVSDPTNPHPIGSGTMSFDTRGIAFDGQVVYLTDNFGLMRAFDVTDPLSPVQVGQVYLQGGAIDVTLSGSVALVASNHGLELVDVADPTSLTPLASAPITTSSGQGVDVDGTVAYLAAGSAGLHVFDISCLGPQDGDGDGLDDDEELVYGTDPTNGDTDGDGLSDGEEILVYLTDPVSADTDLDGLDDGYEVSVSEFGCPDLLVADTDGDGVLDGFDLDPCDDGDFDDDGLQDIQEIDYGTDPTLEDTDGDGLFDGTEVDMAQGGTCPNPTAADSDGDSLPDGYEAGTLGTDPCSVDTDGDAVPDDVDPLPTEPGVTTGYLEDALRSLCATTEALGLEHFAAPNDNAKKGRRNAMCNKLNSSAKSASKGKLQDAYDSVQSLIAKLDDDPTPKDWMVHVPGNDVMTQLRLELEQVGYLISLEL